MSDNSIVSIEPAALDPSASPDDPLASLWIRWQGGDSGARDQLIHQLLPSLRQRVAARLEVETPDQTSTVTVWVAEVLSSLLEAPEALPEGPGQMLCLAVESMRRILVETARADGTARLSEGEGPSALEVAMGFTAEKSAELVQVDEALDELATFDAAGAQALTLRYFGGLSHPEMASAMDLSEAKALMVWVEARAWLYMQFQPDLPED